MRKIEDPRTVLALSLLQLFPSSIRVDAAEDPSFQERYGLSFDATITLKGLGVSFKRSKLFVAVRALYEHSRPVAVETIDGRSAELSIEATDSEPSLYMRIDGERVQVPSFWMLSGDKAGRLASFKVNVAGCNLPDSTIKEWRGRIEDHALGDDEVADLMEDLRSTPQATAEAIRDEFSKDQGDIPVLVPRLHRYYKGLIGDRGDACNVSQYAKGNARRQVERLLDWDFEQGLAQCLLFCANPQLSALVDISGKPAGVVERFFTWLARSGDRFSQIAGVEIGIRALAEYPKIEPILLKLIEDIRDEDTSAKTGRLALTANLFVFVDGELARSRVFANEPPYWRRLAATAQSSLIERILVELGAEEEDSSEWVALRAQDFYMQTLADLREEPRWPPDLMNARQLRLELLMRARIAATDVERTLPAGSLRDLLLNEGDDRLVQGTEMLLACAPSPVEGGMEAPRPFPEELLADLRKPLEGTALEVGTFASVVNFSLMYRFDHDIAGLISRRLREVRYRVDLKADSDITFTLLMGLATIAASARHPDLADEVRILVRILVRRGDLSADAEGRMRIALLACASRKDKDAWCKAVGEWLLEIANGDFGQADAARFRSYVRSLCHAVPELWEDAAKVDAALAAIAE